MTDKEIIIDGINVAGCEYLYDNIGCDIDECYCNGCDCYFKQLARKEQECEELKEIFKEYAKSHHYNNAEFEQERNSLIQEIQYKNRYKQALEKIEEILTYYANSSMGVKNIDGTFSLKNEQEAIILNYDPRRAQEGLKIINEVKE